ANPTHRSASPAAEPAYTRTPPAEPLLNLPGIACRSSSQILARAPRPTLSPNCSIRIGNPHVAYGGRTSPSTPEHVPTGAPLTQLSSPTIPSVDSAPSVQASRVPNNHPAKRKPPPPPPPPPRLEEGGQAPPSPGRRRTSPAAAWKEEDKPRRRHPRIASPCPPRPPPRCNSRRAECSPTPCTIRGRGQGRRATLGRKGIPRGRDSGGTPLPPTHNTDPLLAEPPPGISVGE
ncbi:Putative cytochrome P450 superfamily protein, partial [Zea mays]